FFSMSTQNFFHRARLLSAVVLAWACTEPAAAAAQPAEAPSATTAALELGDGDKLVIIGNTLAERMQHDGYFETSLQARFPDKRLGVRNLGWSADEIDLRPRSANFEDHGHGLSAYAPDVGLAMFGLNEAFAGPEGLDDFRTRFDKFIAETKQQIG